MTVSITELRQIANRLFDHLETRDTSEIALKDDYYWSIPRAERNDPSKEPVEFTLGQLSDDLTELRKISGHSAEPIAYALVWLSSVLREVGETVVG